jgi:hypothetical protein
MVNVPSNAPGNVIKRLPYAMSALKEFASFIRQLLDDEATK